jgi:general L-amino acid transport system substrate-binding protein
MKRLIFLLMVLIAEGLWGATLDAVRERGVLRCGVNTGLPGFSAPQPDGTWRGFDVDICRAIAAAVLQSPDRVTFVPLSTRARFPALAAGEIDVLARNTTWTFARDTQTGARFVGISYYDGQGFLVAKRKGLRSALQLDGAKVCVQPGTTSEDNVRRYFTKHRMRLELVQVASPEAMIQAYEKGECAVMTSDRSQLYALRTRLQQPTEHLVLPEVVSREPLGPAVRSDDFEWFTIVRWVLYALIEAEQMDITSGNVERVRASSTKPLTRQLLGLEGDLGKGLRLDAAWFYRIIRQVGNYGEVYARNIGAQSALKIQRGLNAPWLEGGLLYSPPLR